MRLLHLSTLCTASLLILSGCGGINPLPKKKIAIDSTLPVVSLTKNGIIRDMKTVAFEWKSIQDPRVKEIYIYKQTPEKKATNKLDYYDSIKNRYQTHYLDADNKPGEKYSYAFRVVSDNAQGRLSKTYNVTTLPVLDSVAWIHSIAGLPRCAKIIWRPHENQRVASYIIERKSLKDEKFKKIATLKGRLNAEFIDKELADNAVYLYRIRVKTYDGIISRPSKIVKSVTKALPQGVAHISATKNLPQKIKIEWSASKQKDFHQYYLYRSKGIESTFEPIAKLYRNYYIDNIGKDGKVYFYRVSVVDKDGLESKNTNNTIMGMTLSKPEAPLITDVKLINSGIKLSWKKQDSRIKSFKILRKLRTSWLKENTKEYKNIINNSFIDNHIEPDTTYIYKVYGVDKYGIVSKPSPEVKIKTPESNQIIKQGGGESFQEIRVIHQEEKTRKTVIPVKDLDVNEM